MLAACLCTVKRGDRIGALILIKTANMASICTEEVSSTDELQETARGTSGFGSTGVGKLKRHHHGDGGKADGAKKAKRQSSTESDESTSDDESESESEEQETEYSVCDTDLD